VSDLHLVLHGLAIKKHADAAAVAGLIGMDAGRVAVLLQEAAGRGRVVEAQGRFMLTPLARMALDGEYSRRCAGLRSDAGFVAAYESFEVVNATLKSLITEWQTIDIGGERVTNDHSDKGYDSRIIDRLGELHERADTVLARLAAALPRLQTYRGKLLAALEQAEDGDTAWVSDARIESYHTVWFELHEDLLRVLGRRRAE
jgi:hypothetical protein